MNHQNPNKMTKWQVTKLFFLLFMLATHLISAQEYWSIQLGGTGDEYGNAIEVDAEGNIYSAGFFTGSADFDPSTNSFIMSSTGGKDMFISKFDSDKKFIWAKKIGGTADDEPKKIVVDSSGFIYITGYFNLTADFDPNAGVFNLSSQGARDIFLCKLDFNGNLVWAKNMGGSGDDFGYGLTIDNQGFIINSGSFSSSANFTIGATNTILSSSGGTDIFYAKHDSNANLIWVSKQGGTLNDNCSAIANDSIGNIYSIGSFQGNADFDPSQSIYNLLSNGLYDSFISKISTNGSLVWAKGFGGLQVDEGYDIAVDKSGKIYVTGYFSGPADFDPGSGVFQLVPLSGSVGYPDVFICKFDSSGNFIWAKQTGGGKSDIGYSIKIDSKKNVYVTGHFSGTVDFDPGSGVYSMTSPSLSTGLHTDIFISKLDSNGIFKWAKRMGGKQYDGGQGITVDRIDNIICTGNFSGVASFDPSILAFPTSGFTLTTFGMYDAFITKLIFRLIYKQPVDKTALINADAEFYVKATSNSSYRWQVFDGANYQDLTNSGQFSGVDDDTLHISNVNSLNNFQKYRCIVQEGGCQDTSQSANLYVAISTGSENPHTRNTFIIYPNPTFGVFSLETNNDIDENHYFIYNSVGQIVMGGNFQPGINKIDCTSLHDGVYFICIGKSELTKLIIAKGIND